MEGNALYVNISVPIYIITDHDINCGKERRLSRSSSYLNNHKKTAVTITLRVLIYEKSIHNALDMR